MNKINIKAIIWGILSFVCVSVIVVVMLDIVKYSQDENKVASLTNSDRIGVNTEENNQDIVKFSETHLYIEDTNIDYDVVQGTDNEYYLTHTPDGKYNKAGWIFFDYRVTEESKNKIIYGHNRVTGSMLGSLTKLTSVSYFDKNGLDVIHLMENNKDTIYRVYTVFVTDINFDYLHCNFEDDEKFMKYIKSMKSKNTVSLLKDVEVTSTDDILTLSTCAGEDRLVVQAVKLRVDDNFEC